MSLRFAAVCAVLLVAVTAPTAQAQFSIGPRVGLNLARFSVSEDIPGEQHRLLPGAQLGVAAQVRLGRWALQPALVFSQKGSWNRVTKTLTPTQGAPVTYKEKLTTRIPYLELPLHLAYAPRWARGAQVFAGPYLAVGIGGYMESDPEPVTVNDYTLERFRSPISYPTLFGGGDYSVRWQDVGLNAGLGYQRGRLLAQLQQSFGATNVWPDRFSGQNAGRYHRVTSFTLSYLFGPQPAPEFLPAD